MLRHCFHQIPPGPEAAVSCTETCLWGQLRLWPGPAPGCAAHGSTDAQGRLISTVGTMLVCSDVSQALSLQSRLWGCKSVVCMRRDFSSSSLAQPLGLSDGFSHTSACGPLAGICSQGCPGAPSRIQAGGDGHSDRYGGACSVQQEQEPLLIATVLLLAIARAVSSLLRQEPRFPGALL